MISQNAGRVKKSSSLVVQRENKENCNNNVQHCQPPLAKLGKIRDSFALGHHNPDKIISSLTLDSKEERQLLDKCLKKEYTELLKQDYSDDILSHMISKDCNLQEALKNHQITAHLRAKMVDWMIEVLSSYKMSEESFFRSVRYMDKFFKNSQKKLQVSDLHLIGVTSMFTASKYQEIYPFKLNAIYDKICRKKFPKKEIIEMEEQLLLALDFELQQVTPLDIILHALSEIDIPLDKKASEYLQKVSIYLGKMAMHNIELAWMENSLIAAAVIFISLKTVEQVEVDLDADGYMERIGQVTGVKIPELLEASQELLTLAKNFQKQYPNLGNLKKFNNAEYEE